MEKVGNKSPFTFPSGPHIWLARTLKGRLGVVKYPLLCIPSPLGLTVQMEVSSEREVTERQKLLFHLRFTGIRITILTFIPVFCQITKSCTDHSASEEWLLQK